ncbi:MAG: hypothetical protein ACRCVY_02920 [Commensalibacter sp.]
MITRQLAINWGREENWYRYTCADLWCYSFSVLLFSIIEIGGIYVFHFSLSNENPILLYYLVQVVYLFWLTWFVAKIGLDISNYQTWKLILIDIGVIGVFF